MDNQITSLSLALENHDNGTRAHPQYPFSPRMYEEAFSFNTEHTEKVTCRMDATISPPNTMLGNIGDSNRNEIYNFTQSELVQIDGDFTKKVQELFHLLSNKDEHVRKLGIENLKKAILSMVKSGYDKDNLINNHNDGSPREDHTPSDHSYEHTHNNTNIFGGQPRQIFNQALASLLRLSMRCPFQDVRQESEKMLEDIHKRGVRLLKPINKEISRFIPTDQIQPVDKDTENDQTYSLYMESFVHNCRLEHMVMVMGMHPRYLECFLKTNILLLKAKGSLNKPTLCYIAIMAAARHKCSYLVHLMEQQFLLEGGSQSWLSGIEHAPAKLRNLSQLNKFLAHAPWLVTADLIKSLMEGKWDERWQAQDLLQVIILLCHFQSLCSFCHGTGINLELDHERGLVYQTQCNNNNASPPGSSGQRSPVRLSGGSTPSDNATADVEQLMERMKELREREEEISLSENRERFAFAKQEAFSLPESEDFSEPEREKSYVARYLDDAEYNFHKHDESAKDEIFRAQDYNWDDKAYHVVAQLFPEVADLLDEKFRTVSELTYKTLATKNDVDTTSLRRGIWMYVQLMYKIRYDDYNYGEVNSLLETPLKAFIKTVTCHPEKVTKEKYDGFWKQFRHSEKVHVNIMTLEARLQVGLLYGIKAFTEHYVKR